MNPFGNELSDPRIEEAKRLLLEVVKDRQKTITGIRPPNPDLKEHYQHLLEQLGQQRGGNLWFPFLGRGIGNGPLVELLDGSVKYDFISGIGVHHFGHSHPDIISASIDAAITDTVMQGHLQQNIDQAKLIELFVDESGMDHCFLSTTGTMANENALKIALQKNYPANRIIAFEKGFCGRSWAMAQITEKPDVRDGLPVNLAVDYIPFYNPEKPEQSTTDSVEALKKVIARYPKQHALMICELIQGEGGFTPGSSEFFRAVMQILKDNHIAVLADEVQSFGRTSRLFAYQHFGLDEYVDMATVGKLSQVCATLFKTEYKPRPGLLSQTFTSSTQAIHAALSIVPLMIKENFFGPDGKNMTINKTFAKHFERIRREHPNLISGPYGLGAMIAFTPLDGDAKRVNQFVHNLYQAGVLSFICGKNPTRARFLVPVGAVSDQHISEVCQILEKTLKCS
jgi:acetylornithine/N-succinyldiaminopimelate aminotransferase